MNENIDLTEILKDCPEGTKLYSPLFGDVEFKELDTSKVYPINVKLTSGLIESFTREGKLYDRDYYKDTECILFPSKEQRDWSKFTAPWLKKEMDTIASLEEQSKEEYRLKSSKDEDVRKFMQYIEKQAKAYEFNFPNRSYDIYAFAKDLLVWFEKQGEQEEPQVYETEDGKIITYSETDGYKFVEPKFHKGQWIACNGLNTALIIDIVDDKYEVEFFDGNKGYPHIDYVDRLFHLWTIQDAKDGDILASHECYVVFKEIDRLNIKCYCTYHYLGFKPGLYRDTVQNKNAFFPATKEQCDTFMKAMNNAGYKWNAKTKTLEEIDESKFDPKTLKPFDRVLVRKGSCNYWTCDFFSHIIDGNDIDKYITFKSGYKCCIPYNHETKHLVGTTEEAPEYYRYWEE